MNQLHSLLSSSVLLISLLSSVPFASAYSSPVSIKPPVHRLLRTRNNVVASTAKRSSRCCGSLLKMPMSTNKNQDIPSTFPLARRALIEKAREIDPALARGEKTGTYSPVGWSNRVGTVLTPAAIPGVYTADRPFYWNRIDVGCRMTVIELTSQSKPGKPDLFVHSPVRLDDRLKEAINNLGTAKHIVSPNYEHVSFAKDWAIGYPDAYMWGCPSMMEKEPDISWTGEIPYGVRPPGFHNAPPTSKKDERLWDFTEVQPLHFDVEVNPFTGKPFFNEVVFYHTASKTLITTDTFWNYPSADGITNANFADIPGSTGKPTLSGKKGSEGMEEDFGVWELAPKVEKIPFGSSLMKLAMDKIYLPFYLDLMVKPEKRSEYEKIVSFICGGDEKVGSGWDAETVIPAHGDIVRGKTLIKNVLKRHFNVKA